MIDVVTMRNVQDFDLTPDGENLIMAQHRLRYREIRDMNWDAPIFDDSAQTEHDDFDNLTATYLIKRDDNGNVIGVDRLTPTSMPYMILKSRFRNAVFNKYAIPQSDKVYESTRLVFDLRENVIGKEARRRGLMELLLAKAEFLRHQGASNFIGMTIDHFWKSVFEKHGWEVTPMSEELTFPDESKSRICMYRMPEKNYERLKASIGITGSILNFSDIPENNTIPATPNQRPNGLEAFRS